MANVFFDPGERRAARVKDLFARIASRYDLINDLQSLGLHRRWKRRVVDLARPRPGLEALDICSGTGDLAFALAERGVNVVGLDFSEEMLAIARQRAAERRNLCGNTRFVSGDAQQLPFENEAFDMVTVGYGLRNLADWRLGLREMTRVAKPGARLVVLDFGKPPNRLWRALYFGYLRCWVPVLGLLVAGSASAYSYILESLKHYPAQQGLEAAMRELGLVQVRVVNLLGGIMSINYGEKPGTAGDSAGPGRGGSSSLPRRESSDQNVT